MKTLKTLKDIYEEEIKEGSVEKVLGQTFFKNKLKQEAIKWIKYCTYKANQKFADDLDIKFWVAKRVGLMEFFNLTEEDLK